MGEADSSRTALIPGIRPDLLLIKQVDQVRALNGRLLPAAEAWKAIGHRDRHVDADHADLDAVREFACRVAVAGEDRDAVAIFVTIDELARRVSSVMTLFAEGN